MTGPGEPARPGSPSVPPRVPQASAGGRRREGRDPLDPDSDADAALAPREARLVEEAVTAVARPERGPLAVAALVATAFLLGLLRPWDLVAGPGVAPASGAEGGGSAAVAGVAPGSGRLGGSPGADSEAPSSASRIGPAGRFATCAYPQSWRASTIEDWTGRPARVWRAAAAVGASGPSDPAIPFEPVIAATVTAIGWCAPVEGDERPPLASRATLWRLEPSGTAVPVRYERLEPAEPDALGELWVPAGTGGAGRGWPPGRYVIELRSDSGGYVRYLGLELRDRVPLETPGGGQSAPPSASPSPGSVPPSPAPSGAESAGAAASSAAPLGRPGGGAPATASGAPATPRTPPSRA